MKAMLLLVALYLMTAIDVVTGLNLNVYGWGREPLWFSMAVVTAAICLYALGRYSLGMIALTLCCAWLLFYPSKNGFDVALSPTLCAAVVMWLWQKYRTKK